jgi:hypothetical protein
MNTLMSCPSPISKLQHILPPPKCYKLGNVPLLSSSSIVSLWNPPLGPLKGLGVRQFNIRIDQLSME